MKPFLSDLTDDKGRPVRIIADLPQREYFDELLVKGNAVVDALQYSPVVPTVAQNTPAVILSGTCEPLRAGKISGKTTGGWIKVNIPVSITAISGTPNAKLNFQMRNKGGTWVDVLPLSAAMATSVTEIIKTVSGIFPTVANFNAVPFDWQLLGQSDHATDMVNFKVLGGENTDISGYFEPGT